MFIMHLLLSDYFFYFYYVLEYPLLKNLKTKKNRIMDTKSNFLSDLADSLDFMENIPKDEMSKLQKLLKPLTLKKGEYFLRAGEIPNRVGFNISGLLRLFYIDYNGSEVTKHFCFENTLAISYSAFLLREESKLFIQAIEDTELVTISFYDYNNLLKEHIFWQIAARKLAEMLFILKEKRESELLLKNAQERYIQFLKDYPNLESRLNQYHIASYLGITPESLSRIKSGLK
jgi:CRP-like cAMP-binding protein